MYYPYLRGRQNELLAIKELLNENLLSTNIIPIIEPVKLSPTIANTIDLFKSNNRPLVLIRNPQVGTFAADAKNEKNAKYLEKIKNMLSDAKQIKRGIIVDVNTPQKVRKWSKNGVNNDQIVAICTSPDSIQFYENAFTSHVCTLIPDESSYRRRIKTNRILLEDNFNKMEKNSDYIDHEDEFFSESHLYYEDDNYQGFSDYSIIGKEYNDSGFAPYAVAIHIVYFDEQKCLRIHHFVSTDNDDISDPARKFYQAVTKLVEWNKTHQIQTKAMHEFERIYNEESYPGLGVVKKLSIMHHLELMSMYLDGKIK